MSDLADLLRAGDVDGFNDARGARGPDLFAEDLPNVKLVGVDLSHANLEKSDLTEADLTEANLVKANMAGIDATQAVFRDVMGIRIRLRDAFMEGADFTGADLSRADLAEANVSGSKGEGVRLIHARLNGLDATKAVWPDADLSEAGVGKADFTDADLRRVDLSEAAGHDAVFERANLDGAVLRNARLGGANLREASLVGARLHGANLAGADFTGANLTNADLTAANLTGAKLAGAVLAGVVLADACLDDVELSGLDLSGADLTGLDPRVLGLSDDQIADLGSYGSDVDPEVPLRFARIAVARSGPWLATLWLNQDGESPSEEEPPPRSVRWALVGPEEDAPHGVLPVSAVQVQAWEVVARADGFELLLLQDRPGGVALVRYPLNTAGQLGAATVLAVGYRPSVRPRFELDGDDLYMWGLAQRGPTVVVHKFDAEGGAPVGSDRLATAQSFVGNHHPVMSCKGGVVVPVSRTGVGGPVRTPDGYPGRGASVIPTAEGGLRAVWIEAPRADDRPGAVRTMVLGGRKGRTVETVGEASGVVAFDAIRSGGFSLVAWIEAPRGDLLKSEVWLAQIGHEAAVVDLGGMPVAGVRFAPAASGRPALVITTLQQAVIAVDLDGGVLGLAGF